MDNEIYEYGGRVAEDSNSYGRFYAQKYEKNGVPKGYDLEKLFGDPQSNIDDIYFLAKYYYHKYGIIMRVVNIIRDFGCDGFKLEFPQKGKEVKKAINDYNDRIGIKQVLRDIIFELALTGNVAGYDRNGKRIDIYPVTRIEVSDLIYNNKPILLYKNDFDYASLGLNGAKMPKELIKKLELAYPKEVALGIKQSKDRVVLNVDNTFFLKTNASRYDAYGVPFILTAFDELAHKTVLKEAERSTAIGIIEKILKIGVGDKDHPPKDPEITFYDNLFSGKKGSIRATVPYFVNPEWIEPSTDIFGKEKFEQVDQDILNALGISLTLIRGEGGGNYAEGFLSITGLIKTIESIREGIPVIMHELYQKELVRLGLNPDHAPLFKFDTVQIDPTVKMEMLKWLFTSAGLPYEVLYEESGYDFLNVKLVRESENEEKMEDTFKLRQQPFQGMMGAGNPDDKAGAPNKSVTESKSDKSQSNNKNPRPSDTK